MCGVHSYRASRASDRHLPANSKSSHAALGILVYPSHHDVIIIKVMMVALGNAVQCSIQASKYRTR